MCIRSEEIIQCRVCDQIFNDVRKDENGRQVNLWKLTHHIKKHGFTQEDYYVKFYLDGKYQFCSCGCGNKVIFRQWRYNKYYKDHKNKIKPSDEFIEKSKKMRRLKRTVDGDLEKIGMTRESITSIYNIFISMDMNFTDIEKTYSIDKRTLKKYWKTLDLIGNLDDFDRICKRHKSSAKKRSELLKIQIDDEILINIFQFLNENPGKHTLKELHNKFEMNTSTYILYKRLYEKFGLNQMKQLLKLGNSSKIEIEFFNILKFYFGKSIKGQFKIDQYFYDYILLDKYLIEFDGEYWHSLDANIVKDKIKDQLAIDRGYNIIRIKESECRNLEILHQIKKIYDNEIKISGNKPDRNHFK